MDLEQLVECYKALGDRNRLRILSLLKEGGELCVCELVEILQMSQPAVSSHMRKLKNAKLVKERKAGQWVFYSIDGEIYPFLSVNLEELPRMRNEIDYLKKCGVRGSCS